MSDIVIKVENLSKLYRIGVTQARYGSLRDMLADAARSPFRKFRTKEKINVSPNYIWALQDVTFNVHQGEVLGIIGRNGAGKSTLLKILAQITKPTKGRVLLTGRVGSLLEVGTGFHPELTGRENIYLNGAILGMRRNEIERKFDEIVDFAEIEQFLDTPAKHYSSGMYMRLAFAVAAHLEPDILVVDEVLAVGDAAFQKKCFGKMENVASEGRTVLFVSHNMAAVKALCTTGLYLELGMLKYHNLISETINAYLNSGNTEQSSEINLRENPGLPAQILSVKVVNANGELLPEFPHDKPIKIYIKYVIRISLSNVYLSLHIHDNEYSTIVFSRDFEYNEASLSARIPGTYTYVVHVPSPLLVPSTYRISVQISRSSPPERINGVDFVCPFNIVDAGSTRAKMGFPWVGKTAIPLLWEQVEKKSTSDN